MKNVTLKVWIGRAARLSRLTSAYEKAHTQLERERLAVAILEVQSKLGLDLPELETVR